MSEALKEAARLGRKSAECAWYKNATKFYYNQMRRMAVLYEDLAIHDTYNQAYKEYWDERDISTRPN